ncbi:UNVERIFIED_CONTAM: Glutaredoxin-C6 [Sesamum angustifolium]|uniref:Glutaredoxin-C6 n=1 Tax=Sesamum angustifolium TaxID=2727405 RepID=A0AAW2MJJ3_9LAMI
MGRWQTAASASNSLPPLPHPSPSTSLSPPRCASNASSENPVIIFTRSSCCMCHVMKRLLSTIGVHPTVIELEEDEIAALSPRDSNNNEDSSPVLGSASGAPALYIGGACVGGLESLVALHLSNNLVPKLVEVGALRNEFHIN